MLGYTEAELRELTYEDVTPEQRHAFEARIVQEQILPQGFSGVYEKEYRRKDGTVFPVGLRVSLVRDDAGQPAAMSAIVRDITERQRAEAELRASEERYRLLFQGATDGMFVFHLSAEGVPERFIEVNESGCALLGYSRGDLLRLTPLDVEVPETPGARGELSRQLVSEGRATFQRTLLAKDGRQVPVEITSHLFQLDGRPTVLAINRNISEWKRLEETARGLAEVARELAGMADFTKASKLVTARVVETGGAGGRSSTSAIHPRAS